MLDTRAPFAVKLQSRDTLLESGVAEPAKKLLLVVLGLSRKCIICVFTVTIGWKYNG